MLFSSFFAFGGEGKGEGKKENRKKIGREGKGRGDEIQSTNKLLNQDVE